MRTSKAVNGFFDVRIYKKGVEREKRQIAGQDQTITFGTNFKPDELPEELITWAREYTDKNGETRMAVNFKISKNCKWFDANAEPVEKPNHATLEKNDNGQKKRFRVMVDFTQLDGDPAKAEPCGYWANAIMFEELSDNPFDGHPLRSQPVSDQGEVDTKENDDVPF